MGQLSLQLFGALQVHVANRPVTQFRSNKVRALLAYLAVQGQPQERGTLAGLLWPEMPESAARRNLTQTLRFLRQALGDGDWIQADRRLIGLNPEVDLRLDVAQFQELLQHGGLNEALTLYQADFLAGFAIPDNIPFEDWLLTTRDRLQGEALSALAQLADQQLAAADFTSAIQTARRQIALDPWREPAYRQLMRAFAGQGDRAGALSAYAECCHVLAAGLGVEPGADTYALYQALQASGIRQPVAQLPRPATPFIGRKGEVAQLLAQLRDPEIRLTNIVGPGGMGKTRLALRAAEILVAAAEKQFADGIHFLELASTDDPAALPTQLAQLFGYRFHDRASPEAQILAYLGKRSILLFLDNLEQLLPGTIPFLEQIIAQTNCRLCLTSRQRLRIQAETTLHLGGMPAASDARELFLLSAQRSYTQFAPTTPEMGTINDICHYLQGVPLAIILAAAWVDTLAVAEIATEIKRDIDFLASGGPDLPPRQRSMRAVFSYSWAQLSPDEQETLARLAIFRGGFTRASGQAIAGLTLPMLSRLLSRSLIHYEAAQGRYELHQLLRQFCSQKLGESGQLTTIGRVYSRYFLSWAASQEEHLRHGKLINSLRQLLVEQDNLNEAWQWSLANQAWSQLHLGLEAIFFSYDLSGRHIAGTELFDLTLTELPPDGGADSETIAFLRARLLNRLHLLTRYSSQQRVGGLRAILPLFQERGAQLEEALALGWLADRAFRERDIPQAIEHYQKQVALLRSGDDPLRLASALGNMANALLWAGQHEAAMGTLRQCLAITDASGDPLTTGLVYILYCAGEIYFTGDYGAAIKFIDRAATIFRELRGLGLHTPWLLVCLVYRGYAALIEGDLADLAQRCQAAHDYVAEEYAAYPQLLADSLYSLYQATIGEYEKAFVTVTTALNQSRHVGSDLLGLQALAIAACGLGELATAQKNILFIWRLSVAAGVPNAALLLSLFPVVASLLTAQGAPERAVELLALGRSQPAAPLGWWHQLSLLATLETRLQTALSPEAYAAAQARGRQLDFKETVVALLADLQAKTPT